MNLVEKLLKIEKGEYTALKTKTFRSDRLSNLTGSTANVTIRELPQQEYVDLASLNLDEDGNVVAHNSYDTNAKIVAAALVEPDVKNSKELLEHLGAATPADAVKILFKEETRMLAEEVGKICGYGEDADSKIVEIKNS